MKIKYVHNLAGVDIDNVDKPSCVFEKAIDGAVY